MDKKYAEYLLNKTRENYNLIAEDFSRTRWNIWTEFNIFRDYIKDGDVVLDAGCGNGRLLELLKDKNINYTGIDISDKLIELAKKRYFQNKFLVGDSLNLPFSDNNFDKVFSVAVLHIIPSDKLRKKALSEMKRVLKTGGFLILTVWDIWRRDTILLFLKYYFLKIIRKSKLDFKDAFVPWANKVERYYHFFTKKELRYLIKNSGFKIIREGIVKNETGKRSNIYFIAEKNNA